MTEFATEVRHYCRNPKCRSKLKAPIANTREAFCSPRVSRALLSASLLCLRGEKDRPARCPYLRAHKCKNAIRSLKRSKDTRCVEIGVGNPIKSGLPEADKYGRAWKVVAGEISPNAFHCATVSDGPDCQWKGGEFERVAKNRAALKAADEAAANGYFTDPDWHAVVSPDGVKCFVTSFVAPARRARALPHPLTADLSIPEFLRRTYGTSISLAG